MASSWPGSIAANAALLGANTTYGPFSRTDTMLTAGLAWPEVNELNVEMSGMLASTVPTGWSATAFQLGSAVLNASQPGPWGSGIGATGVDVSAGGSAYAFVANGVLMANGTDATIAAIPAAAPRFLPARVFN